MYLDASSYDFSISTTCSSIEEPFSFSLSSSVSSEDMRSISSSISALFPEGCS